MDNSTRLGPAAMLMILVSAALGCSEDAGAYDPYADTDDWPTDDSGPSDASTDADTDSDSDTDTDTGTGWDTDTDTETTSDTDTGTQTDSDTWDDTDTPTDSETATEPDTGSESDTGTGPDTDTGEDCSGPGVWYQEDSVLWPGPRCWEDPPPDGLVTWEDAVTHCEDLELGGYDDWTLPNINHLRSLAAGCPDPEPLCHVIDPGFLAISDAEWCDVCAEYEGPGAGGCYWVDGLAAEGCETGGYWSSSEVADYWYAHSHAWGWIFYNGLPVVTIKEGIARVRCVRSI